MSNQEPEAKVSQPEYSGILPLPTKPVKVPEAATSDTVTLSLQEAELVKRILGNPAYFPEAFKSWVVQYMAVNQELIPRSLIQGSFFSSSNVAEVATSESTSSGSYTNLSTTGPELTGLSDGIYLLLFGSVVYDVANSFSGNMSLSYNGSTAVDADSLSVAYTVSEGAAVEQLGVSASRAVLKTLENDNNNTVTAKYKSGGTTVDFYYRWLIALKVGN